MVDGDDWPCELARKTLVEYHTDQQALTRQLVHLMSLAADDLRVGPARLCRRFMTWTLPNGMACRVCGRPGHDVLPGAPPRLFPCDG
jgi:hypothetical protein